MGQHSWIQIIAGIAFLILLFPLIRMLFRQQNALRNVVIWLTLLTALVFGFNKFAYLLPENVKQNFGISGTAPMRAANQSDAQTDSEETATSGPVTSGPVTAPEMNGIADTGQDGPVRNAH